MRKIFRGALVVLILLPLLAVIAEFVFFVIMTRSNRALQKAGLIAVFTGEAGRVEQGFKLAGRGYGSCLVVSRASSKVLGVYQRGLKTAAPFDCIAEDQARTTFENAIHIRRIMRQRGSRSVILVTSWDHMPRSYLLLAILSRGAGFRIECVRVPTGSVAAANWYRSPEGWKRVYNEMVQVWGSFYELAAYRIRGQLPQQAPNQSQLVTFLRKVLLFDVRPVRS